MKRILLLMAASLSLGLAACGAKQQPSSQPSSQPALPERCAEQACINSDVRSFVVDGVRVIVKPVAHPPLVTANIYVDGGAAFWSPEHAGHEALALYVATDGGPQGMPREDYLGALEQVGASVSASSDRDYAAISLFTPAVALEQTFGLMAQALRAPAFEAQHYANALASQQTSVQSRWDSADSAVRELAQQIAWENHPYAVHPQGSVESMASVSVDDARAALERLLVRERLLVVFVGQIDEAQARALVREHLSALPSDPEWASKANFPEAIAPLEYAAARAEYIARPELPTNYILGYFAAPSPEHEDYTATLLATQILRNRLFEEVRTRRNLTYAVSSAIGSRRANIGLLYVTTTNPEATLPVMLETVDGMIAEGGVSDKDVENAVRTWLTHYFMDLQSFSDQAALLARWELLGGSRVNADAFVDALHQVTPADIARVLDRYVRHIQFGVVGNPEQAPAALFTAR